MKPNAKELQWFWLANAGHPMGFYPFKDRFLKRFAAHEGYDLQIIEKHCWTCEGSGLYSKDETCRSCGGDGVYRTDKHWLERWNLSGHIYHRPVGYAEAWEVAKHHKPHDIIEGRIQHKLKKPHALSPLWQDIEYDVDEKASRRAFYRLLLRFEPVNFFYQVSDDIKCKLSNWRARHYWRLMRLRDRLDLFPAVKQVHDEVPF